MFDGVLSRAAVMVTPVTVLFGAAFELVTEPVIAADAGGGGLVNSRNNTQRITMISASIAIPSLIKK